MISIKLEGDEYHMETYSDTSISLKLENPLFFSPEKISPGSYSFPFSIPAGNSSPRNSAKLKNPDVVENSEAISPKWAQIFFDGVPFKRGRLHIQDAGSDRLQSYFTFGLNSISDGFKKAKLRDALNQEVIIDSNPVVRKVHTNSLQINIVVNGIDYKNSGWYYEYGSLYPGGPLNANYPKNETFDYVPFIQQVNSNSPGDRIIGTHWVVRMVKFVFVDNFLGLGPQLTPFDCTDPNVKFHVEIRQDDIPYIIQPEITGYYDGFSGWLQPFLTNTIPTDSPLKYLRFPTISTLEIPEYKQKDLINHNDGDGNIIVNTPESYYQSGIPIASNVNSIQPFITLRGVLTYLADYFDFEYDGDFWEDDRLDYSLLWNTSTLDLPQKFIQDQTFNLWRRSFNLNELVPDINVVEFLRLLQSAFNLSIYYNEVTQKVRLKYRENIAKAIEYNDITKKASPKKSTLPIKLDDDSLPKVNSLLPTFKNVNLSVLNLAIDVVNTIVTNESSPWSNGSIEVETTKDNSLYEFSLNGSAWQSSNIFSGLSRGIYLIRAREVLDPGFEHIYPFAVNRANPTFDYNVVEVGESSPGANDGSISLRTIDDWTQYEYSIDAGQNWYPAYTFNSLSPGAYYVAVRDTNDNAIVKTAFIDSPYSPTDIQTPIPEFNFKQGDKFDLQFIKYEGLRTIENYSYPYLSVYYFPLSPIWNKMANNMLSVKLDLQLNFIDIVNIDWEIKRRFDRVNYLIKSLDIKLTNQGIKITQAELYSLR